MFGQISNMGIPLRREEYHLSFSQRMPLREVAMHPEDCRQMAARMAARAFADQIAHSRIRKVDDAYSVEFHADLYVFSPDQFWQIVQTMADELTRRQAVPTVTKTDPTEPPGGDL